MPKSTKRWTATIRYTISNDREETSYSKTFEIDEVSELEEIIEDIADWTTLDDNAFKIYLYYNYGEVINND